MKFKADKAAIVAALDTVETHVDKGLSIPILGHIKMSVADGVGTIVGTNMNQGVRATFECEVVDPGEICIPAATFTKSVKGMASKDFTLSVEDGRAVVKAGKSTFRVPTLEAVDFPPVPMLDADGTCEFILPADVIARLGHEVGFAVSKDENRPFLHGVNWNVRDGKLHFAATDGGHFSSLSIECPLMSDEMPTILVPVVSMPKWIGNVTVTITTEFIRFSGNGSVLASKLLDFAFPDYRRFVPLGNPTTVAVDREMLIGALNRASIYGAGKNGSAIQITAIDGDMSIMSKGDNGDIVDVIACEGHDMEGCTISHRVIAPVLASFDCENIELRFLTADLPVTVHDARDPDRLALVMPIIDKKWAKAEKEEAA